MNKEFLKILSSDYVRPTPEDLKKISKLLSKILPERTFKLINETGSDNRIVFHPPSLKEMFKLLINPKLKIGESFVNGHWYCDNDQLFEFLVDLLTKKRNLSIYQKVYYALGGKLNLTVIFKQTVFTKFFTRQVKDHYDLSPNIFKQIIEESLIYSCAFFDSENTSLSNAQYNKFNKIIERIEIKDSHRVLDIGCGWGTLASYLNDKTKCQVTGISITPNQIKYAKENVKGVNFFCEDYIPHCCKKEGYYDRIVSVGMLEAIGKNEIAYFFKYVNKALMNGGEALIHTIYKHERGFSNRWIDKYIFHGGYIPTIYELIASIENSGLRIKNIHIHDGINYKKTIMKWKKNLMENCDGIIKEFQKEGFTYSESKRKFKIIYFYLSSVMCLFEKKLFSNNVCQISLIKP